MLKFFFTTFQLISYQETFV